MAQTINLNIIPKGIPDVVNVSQYDIGRTIQFNLYEGAQIYTIPAGATAVIGGKKGDTNIFTYDAEISEDRHTVTAITTEQMTAIAGENLCQLRINSVDAEIATINFRMFVQERPDVGDIESVSEIPAIVELARQQQYNAEAWAKGTKNGIDVTSDDPQYHNHAKYWADDARQTAIGGIKYRGSILFANIPLTSMDNGDMYNITDAFTTDNRFKEGSGIYCEAGTNIIWNDAESLWDLAGGLGGVQSFNGRHGNILPQANDYDATQIKYGTNSNVNTELGNKANDITSFTEASTRANIASGETISTIFGKIKKFFSDLKNVAFTGSYNDLSDTPTIPAAQIQSDWNQNDTSAKDYIKNKPAVIIADSGFWHTSDITYDPDTKEITISKPEPSWQSQLYSKTGFKDNVFVTFKPNATMYVVVGLETDPVSQGSQYDIDYGFYLRGNSEVYIYESGTQIALPAGHTTYAAGDEFRIEYSGGYVKYYHNGALVRSIARAVGLPLYMDTAFYSESGSIYDVEFGTGIGDIATDWIDITKSGQSYGTAKYKIHNGTIYIFIGKTSSSSASWQTIGNIPSDIVALIDVDSSMPTLYTTIYNDISTYAISYVGFDMGVVQINSNTSVTVKTILALPYKG